MFYNNKYAHLQALKRLRCANPLPPGALPTTHADSFTIARSNHKVLTKRILANGVDVPYGMAKWFHLARVDIDGLDTLENLLRVLDKRWDCALVSGAIVDGHERIETRRLLNPDIEPGKEHPATLYDVGRRTLALDMDSVPCPSGVDLRDLHEVGEIVRSVLPSAFHSAGCVVLATSGHCRKPGLRMRMFFRLDAPLTMTEIKRWFIREKAKFLDLQTFQPNQPIYTAGPVFLDPDADPLVNRVARLPGELCVVCPRKEALKPPPRKIHQAPCAEELRGKGSPMLSAACTAIRDWNKPARGGDPPKQSRHTLIFNQCRAVTYFVSAGVLDGDYALIRVTRAAGDIGKTDEKEIERIFKDTLRYHMEQVTELG